MSYRQKNQMMGGVALALLLAILGIAVRKTVLLVHGNQQLAQRTQRAQRAPEQIAQLRARSAQLGEVLALGAEESVLRQELFEQVGTYCQQYQVRLLSLREAETFIEDQLQVETHEIGTEGSFANQLRVCDALEKQLKQGRVASVTFRTVHDRRTKETYLNGQLFIQGVKEINDDKL